MKQNNDLNAGGVLDALKKALAEAGDDAELEKKLKAAISALTGGDGKAEPEPEEPAPEAADGGAAAEEEDAVEEEDAAEEEDADGEDAAANNDSNCNVSDFHVYSLSLRS